MLRFLLSGGSALVKAEPEASWFRRREKRVCLMKEGQKVTNKKIHFSVTSVPVSSGSSCGHLRITVEDLASAAGSSSISNLLKVYKGRFMCENVKRLEKNEIKTLA